mgnify:CR=1 FL=1
MKLAALLVLCSSLFLSACDRGCVPGTGIDASRDVSATYDGDDSSSDATDAASLPVDASFDR